jgi:hypothetical protein
MLSAVTILVGLASILLCTVGASWVHVERGVPDVAVAAVVYAAGRRDLAGALATALVVGWVAASLMGHARGIYLLSLLPVALVTRGVAGRLALDGVVAAAAWCVLAVLLANFTFAVLATVTGQGLPVWRTLAFASPTVALSTGAFALLMFGMLALVEPLLRERQARTSLLR